MGRGGALKRYSKLNQLKLNDVMRAFGGHLAFRGVWTLKLIAKTLIRARRKHPVFARSKDEALRIVGAEYGELLQAVTKDEGPRREREEAAHCVATLIRYINREYAAAETEDKMLAMLEPVEETSDQRADIPAGDTEAENDTEIEWCGEIDEIPEKD